MPEATNTPLVVRFRTDAVQDMPATKKAGRPIHKDLEICEIRFPGDRLRSCVFPAHEAEPNATRLAGQKAPYMQFPPGEVVTYAMLYGPQYAAFKKGEIQPESGTPLAELPFLTESKRRELIALNIRTAETLAALDGQPLKQLGMNGRELKNQAQAYLDKASGSADVTRLAAENESMKDAMAEMRAQIAEMQAERAAPSRSRAGVKESPFADWEDADLKNWLGENGGAKPKGNPSHDTLVSLADELNDQLKKQSAKAAA